MFSRHLLLGCCLGAPLFPLLLAQTVEAAPQRTAATEDANIAADRSDDRYRMQWRRWPADNRVIEQASRSESKVTGPEKPIASRPVPLDSPAKLAMFRGIQGSPPPPPAPPSNVLNPKPPLAPMPPSELPKYVLNQSLRAAPREQAVARQSVQPTVASPPATTSPTVSQAPSVQPALLAAPTPLERIAPLKGNPLRAEGVNPSDPTLRRSTGSPSDPAEPGRFDASGQGNIEWQPNGGAAAETSGQAAANGPRLRADSPFAEPRKLRPATRQAAFEVNAGSRPNPLRNGSDAAVAPRAAQEVVPASNWTAAAAASVASNPTWTANPLRSR